MAMRKAPFSACGPAPEGMQYWANAVLANEVLAKFVCFNLTRVILSQVELGIEANFWPKDDEPRDVIPLRSGR